MGWRLETCTKPSDDSRVGADSNANERVSVHANFSNVESKAEARNDVSNSPAPVNASNPGLSGPETPSSQSVDMQTHHVDVNCPPKTASPATQSDHLKTEESRQLPPFQNAPHLIPVT